jgi:hypothetical protein
VEAAASLGVTIDHASGWFGGIRVRYLGQSALLEDDSVRAPSSTLANVDIGRRFDERFKSRVGVYTVLDREASAITYSYESRLTGESQPVNDIHFHPVEPRTVRVTAEVRFS